MSVATTPELPSHVTMKLHALAVLTLLGLAVSGLQAQEAIRFNRDIRPILSENCYQCHGPDKNARMANLRLDSREAALASEAFVPGDPQASKLVRRITADDSVKVMPPAFANKKLTPAQKDLLTRWVAEGASYEMHWAYIPPERSEAPAGPAAIDFFIDGKLAGKGLKPAGAADPRTLARRLSFDLTGMPPEPATVDAFVADNTPKAYEKLVDDLLASPHFGERMAVHWLDLVRYADTVGFHSDVPINVYPYREYVIRAFNQNKPFDEFTREQLAGDLLKDPTPWQLVASAYNRLNRMTNEGGAQAKEYLAKYASDRVNNLTSVWMGSTVGCAECHDHKFDPFATKDFYQFAAFFADIEEKGVYSGGASFGPSVRVLPDEANKEIAAIDAKLELLKARGESAGDPSREELKDFAAYWQEILSSWTAIEPQRAWRECNHPDIEGCDLFDLRQEKRGFVETVVNDKDKPREAVMKVRFGANGPVSALLFEAYATKEFDEFLLSEFQVERVGASGAVSKVSIGPLLPDREEPDGMLYDTLDGIHHTAWGGQAAKDEPRQAAFVFEKPVMLEPDERLQLTMIYNARDGRKIAGRFRLSYTSSEFPELPPTGELRRAVRRGSTSPAGPLMALYHEVGAANPNWWEIRRLERRKKTLLDHAYECLITEAVEEPRTIRVLARGNWMDDSGDIVEPQAPHFLDQIPANGRRLNRRDLANWLVGRHNPLTARVYVNHLWKLFFGTGISKVLNDLGSQGDPPVNQELLDWLAVEFMESGWDVKHIVRTILLSNTYRRSSTATPELKAADPYNRLYGRQSAMRLDAEFIRDSALRVSGLLNPKLGGPSAHPYQPAGYYKELNFPKREYEPDHDENQFRRGLYSHWQRTFVHPSLMAFDAPSREECTAERTVSNTPLQSLALLNNPTYVEAARAFAARILGSNASTDAARIEFAFHQAFSRKPRPEETEVLVELLENHRRRFRSGAEDAAKLTAVGISKTAGDPKPDELAAWTTVARALFNKHEFIMRY